MRTETQTIHPSSARAAAAVAFAVASYLAFQAVFLAFVAFLAGILPQLVDLRLGGGWLALLVDAGLVLGFAVQHSIMARPWFKRRWTRIVPEPLERATYVLAASVMLGALVVLWQPISGTVWSVEAPVALGLIWSAYAFGFATVLVTTFLIDHFELFGLRQAWTYATGQGMPEVTFKTPSAYKIVRHPMQLGFVIALWAAPEMSAGRLAVAILLTGYILVALVFEERDLVSLFGDEYRAYQVRVPRLLPRLRRR